MRRSFEARGGGGGGGDMLKTFRRAVRAGVAADPLSHSSIYKPLSLSTSTTTTPFSPRPLFLSAATRKSDDLDWVSVNEFDFDFSTNFNDDVFGSVPSTDEVLNAVSALQLVVDPTHYSHFLEDNRAYNLENTEAHENASPTRFPSRVSSFGSESDWIEPSLHICYPSMLEHHGSIRVYDALHLLQTEPSIKRMVISLSSDKAVWDAVLNNEMVRELRDSLGKVEHNVSENHDDNNVEPERVTNILSWVYEQTKVKMIEIIEKIVELVNELFQHSENEETEVSTTSGRTEEMLQISLMLSIMVLIIVVINRSQGAVS